MKKLLALLIFVLAVVGLASAGPLTVEYLDGTLEVQRGGRWTPVDFGDLLQEADVLRVAAGTIAELASDGARLTLSAAGTYKVADLLASSRRVSSWGMGAMVTDKLKTIAQGGPKSETAAMGVRGDEAGAVSIEWMEDGQDTMEEGRALLAAGRYAQAGRLFEDGLASALTRQEEQDLLYHAGYAYALAGNELLARRYLLRVQADPYSSWFPELVLLKGRLLIEGLSFRQALELFDSYLRAYPGGSQTQEITYFMGLCHIGLGDRTQAQTWLMKAREMNPSSTVGREASKQLQSL